MAKSKKTAAASSAEKPAADAPKPAARKKAAPKAAAAPRAAAASKAAAKDAPAPKAAAAPKAARAPRAAATRGAAKAATKPSVAEAPAPAPAPAAAPAARATPREQAEVTRRPSVRLHKFLAHGGAGSRREAETFIEQGRVSVNGKPVTQLGFKVDPEVDRVLLDGEPIQPEERVYYLLHKPAGFVCTNHDERGRPRAVDLLRGVKQRIYTVGRLDVDSLGLILVTNDGDLANIVCHPRYRITKRYQVAVKGFVTREQITKLEAGVWLAEGKSSPAKVVPLGRNPRRNETILEMTIFEGRNREIRRVFAGVGLNVRRLLRISIGPIELPQLQPGEAKQVRREDLGFVDEAKRLYEANREAWDAELPPPKPKVWRPRPKGRPDPRGRGPGGPRRGGGGGGRFGGRGGFGGPPRGGGFGGPRREGGFGGPPRGGDYGPARRGDDEGPARREDDFGGGGFGGRPPMRRPFDGPPGGGPRRPRPHY